VAFRILGEPVQDSPTEQVGGYQARLLANANANRLNLSTYALESLLLDAFAVYDVGPAHVLALNANGHSMLHLAVMANMPRLAKWLSKRGGSVLIECPDERVGGWTALMWASFLGRTECVEALIQQGADGWFVDDSDRTAYDLALGSNHKPIAALLDNVYGLSDSDSESCSSETTHDSQDSDMHEGPSILLANASQEKMQVMEVHASVQSAQSESETEDDTPTSYSKRFWHINRFWKRKEDPASPTHTTTTSMQGLPIQLSVFSWAGQSSSRGNSSVDAWEGSPLQMLWLSILTGMCLFKVC